MAVKNYLLTESSAYLTTEGGDYLELQPVGTGWMVEIDWMADGNYTNESARLKSIIVDRGRDGTVTEKGFVKVSEGICEFTLDNYDRRYDPYYADGDLYGYILPNRPVKVSVRYGVVYEEIIFTGRVRDIRPQFTESKRFTRFECTDGLNDLRSQGCSNTSLQTDYKVSDAIEALLSGIITSTDVEDNLDEIPYYWTQTEKSVLSAIDELAQAYSGEYFIDVDGTFVYKARSNENTPTLTLLQSECRKDIELIQPWDNLKNAIQMVGYPRVAVTSTVLWTLGYKPFIEHGESITVWAKFAQNGVRCPASLVSTPVEDTDYDANTQEDGGGTDMSGSVNITKTDYGSESKLVISNTHGSLDLYLTLMQLQGTALVAEDSFSYATENTSSISTYGRQSLTIDNVMIQTFDWAASYAELMKLVYSSVRRIINVKVEERASTQFALELFNLVSMGLSSIGLEGLYILTNITHDWSEKRGTITTWRFEPHPSESTGDFYYFPGTWGEYLVY